jgi:hypothetical protein
MDNTLSPSGEPLLPAPTVRPVLSARNARERLVSNKQLSNFANSACTLDGELDNRPTCSEDMVVWLDELRKYVGEDYSSGERSSHENYFADFREDFKLTCTILVAFAKHKSAGESHSNRCLIRMRAATREIVSIARDKYPKKNNQ